LAKNIKKTAKTLGPQAARFVIALHERNQTIFGLRDVKAITGKTEISARSFVRTLVDRGLVTRLKPGLYILVPFEMGEDREYMGDPLLVAKALVGGRDYYLSHATAMEIHQMVTQPQLVVYVSTPERSRPRVIMGTEFRFVFCRKKSLFGVAEHWVSKQEKVQVSDLERTVIDGLKNPEYCGGLTEVAKGLWMQRHKVSAERLMRYAVRLNVGAVIRRLGFLLELYEIATEEITRVLRDQLTNSYAPLDPALPANGKHVHRWRLHVNVRPDELLSVVRT
jgi:predicted transcriptional regulator of viral defense system